ncbi:MAG: ATP-dependent Clp protease ATP-binding subunit, partial [Parcubacteria group bacterium]|nr:ATP-dependent Clp protease ATP-binding subunit [Parcubacteria group bacterium]
MAKRDFFWFCLLFLHGRRLTQEQAVALRKRLIDILIKRDLLAAKDITNTLLHVVPPRVEGEDGIFIPEDHRRESSDGAYSGETDLVQVPLWGRKFSKRDASALRYALVELMLEFQLMKVKEVAYTFLFVDQAEKDSGGLCWLVIPPTGWQEEKAPDGMFTVAPGSEDEKHMRLNSYRHRKVPHLEVFPRAAEGGFCYLVVPTEAWRSSHGDLEGSFSVGFEVSEKSLAVSPAPQLALEPPHTEAPSAHEGLIATVTPPKPEGHTILIDLSKTDDVLAEAATFLRTRIVGQPKVIKHLLELLVAQRGGLHLGPQPLGQKLFCGLTGIGKTHSAKVFAKLFIGDLGIEDSLTVVKCPEFSDSHNILKLVGAPPSYLGHGNVALLSQLKIDWPQFVLKVGRERVDRIMRDPNIRPRHKWENVETAKLAMLRQLYIENGPYWSVILFDEIEK